MTRVRGLARRIAHGTFARMLLPRLLALGLASLLSACANTPPSSAPPGSYLCVLDKDAATLRLVEPNSGHLKDSVSTGNGPHECAVSPDGELVVVCNYGDGRRAGNTLSVYRFSERRITDTIDLAPHARPHGIAFVSNRNVLVTSETSQAVLEVDLTRGRVVRTLATGAETSHMLALTPDKRRAFTANLRANSISALDLEKGELIGTVPTGNQPEGLDVSPDGREVWVGHNADDKLVVLDARTLATLGEVPCGKLPIRVKCTPDGKYVLVSCARSGELAIVDRAARREVARVSLPARSASDPKASPDAEALNPVPVGIAVETRSRYAYVSLTAADQVAVIDLERRAVVRTFATGAGPDGLAWLWRRGVPSFLGDRDG